MVVVGPCPRLRSTYVASRGALAASCLAALLLVGCRSAPVASHREPTVAQGAMAPAPLVAQPTPAPQRAQASEPAQARPGTALDPVADTRLLSSPDFRARSLAAQRLVRGGASSLAALGAAGAQPVPQPGSPGESTTAPVIAAIVAEVPDPELVSLLASPYAGVREQVAREAGRRGTWDAVPGLIEALADASPGVRSSAHGALKRITGEVADPRLTQAARGDLRERWRAWWGQVGRARAAGAPTRG